MSNALFDTTWGLVALSVAVGCLVFAAVLVATGRRRGEWLRDRLGPYEGTDAARTPEADAAWKQRMDQVFGVTERRFAGTRLWQGLERRLDQAGMTARPAVVVWLAATLAVAGLVLVGLVAGAPLVGLLVACLAAAVPFVVVHLRAKQRLRLFDDQLPNVLQTMAGSLQVGHSFNQGLQAIVDEGQQPAADEFGRVITEMRFGRPADEALESLGKRLDSPDFGYVLMSVRVQRQVGGSLARLFETVAETVRERQQFRRKVRAITATGRLSAYFLVLLPVATAALLTLVRPGYLEPLFTNTGGQVALVACCVMTVVGGLMLRRIVDVKG
jgi:tight adherence protein B